MVQSYAATDLRRLVFDVRFQNSQHGEGIVHAVDGDALAGNGKQDAAGSAGNFQYWTAISLCQIEVEGQINEILFDRVSRVVMFGGDAVGFDATLRGFLCPPLRPCVCGTSRHILPSLFMTFTPSKLLLTVDLAGTLLFAIEGALAAVDANLDLFGVMVLAFATALVGGIVRDVLIGAVPPSSLRDWRYPD